MPMGGGEPFRSMQRIEHNAYNPFLSVSVFNLLRVLHQDDLQKINGRFRSQPRTVFVLK